MSLSNKVLGSACALALAGFIATPALADMTDFDGLLGADYSHIDANSNGNANLYGVTGSAMFGLGSPFAVQADGGYHNEDVNHGGSVNSYNVDGTAFWRGDFGRLGAVVGYNSASGDHQDGHATTYGGFAEWYAAPWFTVGLKGGGFDGSASSDGDYLGAQAVGYLTPDVALSGIYGYTHLNHFGNENDYSAKAEWLISERMPVSVYGMYTRSDFSGGAGSASVYSVGIKFYVDPVGASPLVERQREGVEQFGTSFTPTALNY